jgi:hypothetical protein
MAVFVFNWLQVSGYFWPRAGDGFGELGSAFLGLLVAVAGIITLLFNLVFRGNKADPRRNYPPEGES